MNEHSDATAVITGGARGIGAAIARRLVLQGHPVAIVDLDSEAGTSFVAELTAGGAQAVFIAADITDEASVDGVVERVASELAAPTILVNNAGLTRDDLLFRMSWQNWETVMRVHLGGAFLMTKAVQSQMVDAGWGRIVNLSSTSALGNRGQANYSTAKAGIQGFTKTLAIELGRFGVTANAIAPGFIETDMTARTAERLGIAFDEYISQSAARIPVGRVGTPDDIAALTAFLVSDDAGFISGQVIYAAGGPKT